MLKYKGIRILSCSILQSLPFTSSKIYIYISILLGSTIVGSYNRIWKMVRENAKYLEMLGIIGAKVFTNKD